MLSERDPTPELDRGPGEEENYKVSTQQGGPIHWQKHNLQPHQCEGEKRTTACTGGG